MRCALERHSFSEETRDLDRPAGFFGPRAASHPRIREDLREDEGDFSVGHANVVFYTSRLLSVRDQRVGRPDLIEVRRFNRDHREMNRNAR